MAAVIRLVFLGPPGTGKGTQARRMSERFSLVSMSSGDALRREIKADSDIGRRAAHYVSSGTLVPDELITGVMLAAVDAVGTGRGLILDGFPRTVGQAELLSAGLGARGMRIDAVLDFRMDDARLVERLATRRVCNQCGATYNARFSPPRVEGVCDACGGAVGQREDDREDVIRTRLATYRRETLPLTEYYRRQGLLREVDADRSVEQVDGEVTGILAELGARE